MDTFQSADMLQALKDRGFNADTLSVDRVDNESKVCKPYQYLKSTIYEQRILIPKHGTTLLTEELIGLERNNNNGKIDHSPNSINSKDSADAVAGSTYTASLHAEEFAYEYGENLNTAIDTNFIEDNQFDFTKDLKTSYLQNNAKLINDNKTEFIDFGTGQPMEWGGGVMDGIMVW